MDEVTQRFVVLIPRVARSVVVLSEGVKIPEVIIRLEPCVRSIGPLPNCISPAAPPVTCMELVCIVLAVSVVPI